VSTAAGRVPGLSEPAAPPPDGGLGARPGSAQGRLIDRLAALPWWAIFLLLAGVILLWLGVNSALYHEIFVTLAKGITTTIQITVCGYGLGLALGLIAGLGRISRHVLWYNLATLYVQVIRGVPILVQIIYVAFVITPAAIGLIHALGAALAGVLGPDNALVNVSIRDFSYEMRVILALGVAYGGFEAETFRAGIESLGRGQMEAARSLGMTYAQAMRHVILPQAVRRVLPTLGNDLIAMLKDSSLASYLGVAEITQRAKLYASATFQATATYNTLAFTYLTLTLLLSVFVKWLERRYRQSGHAG
jgi:polar amino acid transport system permease protein